MEVPSGGKSGWNLSDREVLLLTFLLALAAGAAVVLGRAFSRRLRLIWLARRLRRPEPIEEPEYFEDIRTVLQPWLVSAESNGSNGSNGSYEAPAEDEEPVTVASGDVSTGT